MEIFIYYYIIVLLESKSDSGSIRMKKKIINYLIECKFNKINENWFVLRHNNKALNVFVYNEFMEFIYRGERVCYYVYDNFSFITLKDYIRKNLTFYLS